jgi:hypothetical protein
MKKAQTSIVMILMVLVIFAGLAIFLLSMAQNVAQEDYMNIYAHNTLLSLLRTDTGEGSDCKYVSDVVTCAAYGMDCESGADCGTLSTSKIDSYMVALNTIKSTYSWYIGVYDKDDTTLLGYGDEALLTEKTKKWSASETVYKRLGRSDQNFIIRIILAKPS